MLEKLMLNDNWKLHDKDTALDVCVPFYVHTELAKAGIIPDPYYRDNAKQCQWIEDTEWRFTRTLVLDKVPEQAKLHFDGIDTYCDIYINGKHAAFGKNMFVPIVIDAGEFLKAGENTIEIQAHPYKSYVAGKPEKSAAFGVWDRVYVRRVQCTFYWDWVERYVSMGVWRDVYLTVGESTVIDSIYAATTAIYDTTANLTLYFKAKHRTSATRWNVRILSPEGTPVWHRTFRAFMDEVRLDASIPSPQLWWPNGYGEHPLYTIEAELEDNGVVTDRRSIRTGIRTVCFECIQDEPGSDAEKRTEAIRAIKVLESDSPNPGESMTLIVNGRRIFCKGGNWVPCTPFPGTASDAHYEKLLKQAKDGNMNLLRVWGGGIYEKDCFYDLCDEMGIMLSHDFMVACGHYPDDDEEWVENFRDEVEASLLRLRNHTSIISWSGSNENCSGSDWDSPDIVNLCLVDRIFRPLLAMLDPVRIFFIGSPYGGKGNNDLTIGDNHVSWWWLGAENITTENFDMAGRFVSESPFSGYPLPSVMRKFLAEEDIADDSTGMLEYHIKNNPFFTEVLKWPSVLGRLKKNAEVILGKADSRRQELYNGAFIQYEWARLTIEGARRSNWYCSAIQFWMYNDCWPAVGYATVDFYGDPKPGWYGARRAFAPVCGSIKEENGVLNALCLSDSLQAHDITYTLTCGGKTVCGSAHIKASGTTLLCTCAPSDGIVFLDLYEDGKHIDRARWNKGFLSAVTLPEAVVEYSVSENNLTLTCTEGTAIGIAFDGVRGISDNYFDMIQGETVTLACEGIDAVEAFAYNSVRFLRK